MGSRDHVKGVGAAGRESYMEGLPTRAESRVGPGVPSAVASRGRLGTGLARLRQTKPWLNGRRWGC